MPSNLLQAQRDFFGAHTYERVDKPGVFHTEWMESDKQPTEKPAEPKEQPTQRRSNNRYANLRLRNDRSVETDPRFEVKQSMKDEPLRVDPETGEPVRRVISGGYGVHVPGGSTGPSSVRLVRTAADRAAAAVTEVGIRARRRAMAHNRARSFGRRHVHRATRACDPRLMKIMRISSDKCRSLSCACAVRSLISCALISTTFSEFCTSLR